MASKRGRKRKLPQGHEPEHWFNDTDTDSDVQVDSLVTGNELNYVKRKRRRRAPGDDHEQGVEEAADVNEEAAHNDEEPADDYEVDEEEVLDDVVHGGRQEPADNNEVDEEEVLDDVVDDVVDHNEGPDDDHEDIDEFFNAEEGPHGAEEEAVLDEALDVQHFFIAEEEQDDVEEEGFDVEHFFIAEEEQDDVEEEGLDVDHFFIAEEEQDDVEEEGLEVEPDEVEELEEGAVHIDERYENDLASNGESMVQNDDDDCFCYLHKYFFNIQATMMMKWNLMAMPLLSPTTEMILKLTILLKWMIMLQYLMNSAKSGLKSSSLTVLVKPRVTPFGNAPGPGSTGCFVPKNCSKSRGRHHRLFICVGNSIRIPTCCQKSTWRLDMRARRTER